MTKNKVFTALYGVADCPGFSWPALFSKDYLKLLNTYDLVSANNMRVNRKLSGG